MCPGRVRPEPAGGEVAGFQWVAVPEGPEWRLDEGGRCRFFVSKEAGSRATRPCGEATVAALNRGRHNPHTGRRSESWWRYCDRHQYGRWIEDGMVMHWVRRAVA